MQQCRHHVLKYDADKLHNGDDERSHCHCPEMIASRAIDRPKQSAKLRLVLVDVPLGDATRQRKLLTRKNKLRNPQERKHKVPGCGGDVKIVEFMAKKSDRATRHSRICLCAENRCMKDEWPFFYYLATSHRFNDDSPKDARVVTSRWSE